MTHDINIHHEENHESASSYLVEEIRNLLVNSNRDFSIGLSGGNTPKLTYSMMAEKFDDLSKTYLWTIDDRWIEEDNDLSNQRMINEYFERTNANILKFEFTSSSPESDAKKYEDKLKSTIQIFDVAILGMGEDGHVASLFPGTKALENNDSLYVANEVNIKTKWRVTSTFHLLGKIEKIYVLATGESKKNIHKWASTEFEVKSTGVGVHSQDRGIWFLNSELSYRSSKSLNVRLSTEVVKKFKDQYHIDSVAGLEGKKIKVVGTATPKRFCVRKGCPIGAGLNKPAMYIQTQMLIEDIRNIELL